LDSKPKIRAELLFTDYPHIKHISILLSLEIFMKKHQENSKRKNSELDRETKLLEMTVLIPQQTV
jgi:hypothetical protein